MRSLNWSQDSGRRQILGEDAGEKKALLSIYGDRRLHATPGPEDL